MKTRIECRRVDETDRSDYVVNKRLMATIFYIVLFVAAWYVLQAHILPRMGVKT